MPLPKIKTIRNKADSLLTPIITKMHPNCFLQGSASCAGVSQVAHHHIKKSNSSALRYNLDNLIPLCHSCHMMLHQNESKWVTILIQKKGMEWADEMVRKGRELVKTDVHFYIENYERLKKILDEL